jgi:cobalamin biosynthesis Co2+ chelatase CbiK
MKPETIKEKYAQLQKIEEYEDIIESIKSETEYQKALAKRLGAEVDCSGAINGIDYDFNEKEFDNIMVTIIKQYENRIKKLKEEYSL